MSKINLKKTTKKNLSLLFLIFMLGLGAEILIAAYSKKLSSNLEEQSFHLTVKNKISQGILQNIYLLESTFFHLSAFPNLHTKNKLFNEIQKTQSNIISLLQTLNQGGVFQERYDLNDMGQNSNILSIPYQPIDKNEFAFENADIVSKIKSINTALIKVSAKIDKMNNALSTDVFDLQTAITDLKLELKFIAPTFQRLKENANNIIYKNTLLYQRFISKTERSKQTYFWIQLILTITIALILLWLFRRLSTNIELAAEEVEKTKDYLNDVLNSQKNITVISDGKQILDVSGGFFDYFDNYPSLEAFKLEQACICEKFIKEDGYLYKFEDKNWLEFLLENPEHMHKAKMQKQGKVSIFHVTAHKSKKYQRRIVTLYDITENEQMYAQLAIEKDKAISATQAKGEFLANMSHEIRTPLNAILGFIPLLQEKKFDAETHKYLATIDNSGHSLLGIINDILDFSKIESGKFELDPIKFDPKHEFCIVSDLFRAKASQKNIVYSVSFDENLPATIYTDILRIKQVISNLLSNAIKFSEAYQPINLNIEFDKPSSVLTISVSDKGIGLTPQQQVSIFDAFSQAESSTTRKYGGTGLGLSISAKLVDMLGGELKVKSKIGEGSCFYFKIPVEVIAGKTEIKKKQVFTKFKGHLLLVEDNKTNQMLMAAILKRQGTTFDVANDGIEAIEMVQQLDYDLVLMDENMPNLNGIEATKQIRELNFGQTKLPIIALTANAMTGDRERFIAAGMNDYLTKPVNMNELQRVFSDFLDPV